MKENRKTRSVTGVVNAPDDTPAMDGWVSPDIAAAQAGETVDFSKDLDASQNTNS